MKERLDMLLVRQGLAPSREKAKAIIMTGNVYVNGQREDKAGAAFEEEKVHIEVKGAAPRYVSRGGLKLEKAMESFAIVLTDMVCMDIGASTGGFTDCMLQNGAAKVYSVDVGHGQLAWKLRQDERVVCMEKTNFRYMQPEDITDRLDFASVDVSFISLTKILIPARNLLKVSGRMVCLIKPQFEAGREKVGKKGVVREPEIHEEVIRKIVIYTEIVGFSVKGLTFSPVKGPEGNIEYLIYLEKKERLPEEVIHLTEQEAEKTLQERLAEETPAGPEMRSKSQQELPGGEAIRQLILETVRAAHQELKTDRDERE